MPLIDDDGRIRYIIQMSRLQVNNMFFIPFAQKTDFKNLFKNINKEKIIHFLAHYKVELYNYYLNFSYS